MPPRFAGDCVRGYRLLDDLKMAGGGNCKWAFAAKDGKDYFIKQFIKPKYPRPDGPGSAETKLIMANECEKFEQHQRELNEAVKKVAGADGRLVAAVDFFRDENLFYKVALKVPAENITPAELAKLPLPQKVSLLQNVATAVTTLHKQNIVHGDLKVDNALLEKGSGDNPYIARLIDFDSSYFSGKPYHVEELVGDPPYYSPELLDYFKKRETDGTKLTVKSDVFALGIVFHRYLVGEAPPFPDDYQYLCEAVRAGHIVTSESLRGIGSSSLANLLASMMLLKADDRPSSFEVQIALKRIRDGKDVTPKPVGGTISGTSEGPTPPKSEPRSGLRGKLADKTGEVAIATSAASGSESGTTADVKSPSVGGSSPAEIKKGTLKISLGGSAEIPISGAERPTTPTSRAAEEVPAPTATTLRADLALSGTYRVMLTQLISNLAALDAAVAVKQTPPEAPPRVKGTLRHAPRSLSTEEIESLSDIAEHLEELQKQAGLVVSWLTGERLERPALLSDGGDLVVEPTDGTEAARLEVDSKFRETAPVETAPTDIDDTPAVLPHTPSPAATSETSEAPAPVAEATVTSDGGPAASPEVAPEPTVDISGSHRRAERLKNRDAGPRS